MDDSPGPSSGRSKRQKVDKTGRLSAFEKLKALKGSKNKYEVDDLDSVYEIVDEKSYTKKVLERQNDDWIVDDGGSGYLEDGREIFDDDLDEESIQKAKKEKDKFSGPRSKKVKDGAKQKGNIGSMLMNMKGKEKEGAAAEDDYLGDLLSELKKSKPTPKTQMPEHVKNRFVKKPSEPVQTSSSSSEKRKIEDPDDLMFESRQKSLKKPKMDEKTSTSKLFGHDQSISQTIDSFEDIDFSQAIPTQDKIEEVKDDEMEIESKIGQENKENNPCSNVANSDEADNFMDNILTADFDSADITVKPAEKTKVETSCVKNVVMNEKDSLLDFSKAWDDDFTQVKLETDTKEDNVNLTLPLITDKDGDKILRFFWWDASEDPIRQPGTVYLYGKVFCDSIKQYVSCCVVVKNIPKRVFVLPREFKKTDTEETEENTMEDVFNEVANHTKSKGIKEFRSRKVMKNYAFEREGTPIACEYLEVRYSATYPTLDENYSGPSIEAIFGTSVNALELFLIERKIKGPCWLDIKNPTPIANSSSWTKLQVNCMKMENIVVNSASQGNAQPKSEAMPLPPLVLMTLNVRTALNPKIHQNEVVMVAVLINKEFSIDKPPTKSPVQQHLCLISHPQDTPFPLYSRDKLMKNKHTNVIVCEKEASLLEQLLSIIEKYDPDLLVGYDCGFQLDVLTHRINQLKISNWSRIGKLKRNLFPNFKAKPNLGTLFCGRPICDIQHSAKELNLKLRTFDLQSLCVSVLQKNENDLKEIKPAETSIFYGSIEKLETLLSLTMSEGLYILMLMIELNVMPLAYEITKLAGNILSRTLSAGRAERNEFLLLHAFHQRDYITPDKRNIKKGKANEETTGRKKPAYVGGLVLDPKKGFYDKYILLMDFNSLYPSIIQEYNLCFTTVPGAAYADVDDLSLPSPDLESGVIPTEIRKLVESRLAVKQLMKSETSPELKMQYNIRQLALKLTANSMYGCLGATHCRFYAKGLAALVTFKGREILQSTKHIVEKMHYEVIYGDTDSIMINTNITDYDEVFAVGKKIKQEINKSYKKVELDIDGVFKYLLLLQKKKYAALTISKLPSGQVQTTQEHKGLDIVRRDWCQLACDTGRQILDQLLSDQPQDEKINKIYEIIQKVGTTLREGKATLASLVITKQLSKNPNEYPDKKTPHVNIALRLNAQGGRMWKAGDTVPYIICDDGTERSHQERSYHIDEFKKSDNLKIDVNYYLLSQIFPVILRICEPIEGIDDVLLTELLGISHLYKPKRAAEEQDAVNIPLIMDDTRFKYCLPFKFKCPNDSCDTLIEIKDLITEFTSGYNLSLNECPNLDCNCLPYKFPAYIQNQLLINLRQFYAEYYEGMMECENPTCSNTTNEICLNDNTNPFCDKCRICHMHRIYTEMKLYNQMCYFLNMFNLDLKSLKSVKTPPSREIQTTYGTLKEFMEKQLQRNAYSVVNLKAAFSIRTSAEVSLDVEQSIKRNLNTLKNAFDEESEEFVYMNRIREIELINLDDDIKMETS